MIMRSVLSYDINSKGFNFVCLNGVVVIKFKITNCIISTNKTSCPEVLCSTHAYNFIEKETLA